MFETIVQPWPWYVAGPLVGLTVPLLLLLGGKQFGVSGNLRHMCAALLPSRNSFFKYNWWGTGSWNLAFAAGIVLGAWIAGTWLAGAERVDVAGETQAFLQSHGLTETPALVPNEIFSWRSLATVPGFTVVVGGAFLVGFGARYAGGCTSGHAVSGLADLQLGSLLAVVGFFAGGLVSSRLVLPTLLELIP